MSSLERECGCTLTLYGKMVGIAVASVTSFGVPLIQTGVTGVYCNDALSGFQITDVSEMAVQEQRGTSVVQFLRAR